MEENLGKIEWKLGNQHPINVSYDRINHAWEK